MATDEPIRVGTELPELRRVLRVADLVAYAGATWDWHRLHYDHAYVERAGFERPVVDGQMLGALLAEQVQDALGPRVRVVAMRFRFSTPVLADDEVVVSGRVAAVEDSDGGSRVTVEQSVRAPGGTAIRAAETVVEVWS